jgi:hypothetical protein
MKKYIIAVFVFFVPCVTHAITMCARNNTLVGSLLPTSSVVSAGFSATEPLWRVVFPWGTIFGEATLLSEAEGGKPGVLFGITNVDGNMIPMDTPAGLVGDDANGNPRIYCWCRMTHPMVSRWMSVNYKTGDCKNQCLYDIRYNSYNNDRNFPDRAQASIFRSVFDTLADED